MKQEDIKRVFEIPYFQLENYPKEKALSHKKNGKWYSVSTQQYVDQINRLSRGMLKLGVKRGDKIALISDNRIEWTLVDFAIQQIGAITIPVYPTISEEDHVYIFNFAEIKYAFASTRFMFNKTKKLWNKTPTLEKLYAFDDFDGAVSWKQVLELGDDLSVQPQLDEIKKSIGSEDLCTIIFTSGTTGRPKGVMLTHRNILAQMKSFNIIFPDVAGKNILSFLPLSHVFERTINIFYINIGAIIHYAESLETIAADAQDVKPYFMVVVPRVMEKLYNKILSMGSGMKGIKKMIFFWALSVGKRFDPTGKNNGFVYRIEHKIAKKLVLSKFKNVLGGQLDMIITGSSAIDPMLTRLFSSTGFLLNEGYGLTEHSPVVSTNIKTMGILPGTVGRPLPFVEVKIAQDGEILIKSESVMKGYYKLPEETAEAIDPDGWLHTGDIGVLIDRFIKITDRKKEMFKTSGGKYIAPQAIENRLKQSRFIEQVMVVGENRKYPAAIIEVDFDFIKSWCARKGIEYIPDVQNNEKVVERVMKAVQQANRQLGKWERIKQIRLVPDVWTTEGGELTPTLKIKRKVLTARYQDLIDDIYKNDGYESA